MKSAPSIMAVAAVQFLGSLATLLVPALLLTDEVHLHQWSPATYQAKAAGFYGVLVALPICLSLFGIITSIGLIRLRVWARRVTIFATIPTLICVLWLILRHPRAVGDSSLLVVGDLSNASTAYLLVILAPISLWWWILFTRKRVSSQFHKRSRPGPGN